MLHSGDVIESFPSPKPFRVRIGMTKPEVLARLKSEGFTPPDAANAAEAGDDLWRWRRPWRDGYHYANVRFAKDVVDDVSNLWIDS